MLYTSIVDDIKQLDYFAIFLIGFSATQVKKNSDRTNLGPNRLLH